MKTASHCFDEIRRWANLDDASLLSVFSPSNVKTLHDAILLLGNDQEVQVEITVANFVGLVRSMNLRCKEESRALSYAMIAATELRDQNRVIDAAEIYRRFLRACPSKFYKDIAEHEMRKLKLD